MAVALCSQAHHFHEKSTSASVSSASRSCGKRRGDSGKPPWYWSVDRQPMNLRNLGTRATSPGADSVCGFPGVVAYRQIGSRLAIRSLEAVESRGGVVQAPDPVLNVEVAQPDYSLWSTKRIGAYQDALAQQFAPAVAILRIPKLGVEVPVFNGTGELVLNRESAASRKHSRGLVRQHRDCRAPGRLFSSVEGHRFRRPHDALVSRRYYDLFSRRD